MKKATPSLAGKQAPTPDHGQAGEELRALAQHTERQIHRIQRRMRQVLRAEFASGHLTGPQRMVMAALVRSQGLSLKQLSATVSLAHSTVSGIVDRLETQGMIERRTLESDRRVTLLMPSRRVRTFLQKQMPELALHPLLEALRSATAAERRTIAAGLDTLARLLKAQSAGAATSDDEE